MVNAVRTSNWTTAKKDVRVDQHTYKALEEVKNELTINTSASVILRGTRIVIPHQLQQRVVDLAHEGHQGIVKTKALLRDKVWFPGINLMTEKKVKSCLACQASTPVTQREPPENVPTSEFCMARSQCRF